MKRDFLRRLECPHCAGPLRRDAPHPAGGDALEYGLLRCSCSEYPVVAGIPIFKAEGRVSVMDQTTDSVVTIGPDVRELRDLIRQGAHEEALLRLLVMPSRRTSRWLMLAETVPARFRRFARGVAERSWKRQRDEHRAWLRRPPAESNAMEMIDFFYRRSLKSELYHYFSCRFAQPRHLAALSLASLLPTSDQPVLDLACGFGHILHYWRQVHPRLGVIGLDRNFFQLYVARHWVAPGAEFVCSDADVRLPFPTASLGGVFCSDAFHCFLRRAQCADEIRRLVEPGGLRVLARFGNRLVEPREGYELSPAEYARLFTGLQTRLLSEDELVREYLAGRGPQLAPDGPPASVDHQKWISLVASDDAGRLRNHDRFAAWPHAAGRLRINPLYRQSRDDAGNLGLTFEFPSPWYEFENSGCLQYMPRNARVSADALARMERGDRSPELDELVRQCVVVGMPDRYLP